VLCRNADSNTHIPHSRCTEILKCDWAIHRGDSTEAEQPKSPPQIAHEDPVVQKSKTCVHDFACHKWNPVVTRSIARVPSFRSTIECIERFKLGQKLLSMQCECQHARGEWEAWGFDAFSVAHLLREDFILGGATSPGTHEDTPCHEVHGAFRAAAAGALSPPSGQAAPTGP
jgi:hypothetical protein